MTAYMLTTDGRGFYTATKCRTENGALDKLWSLIEELVPDCFEVLMMGAEREPREVTAEWMMANCRELTEL